MKNKILKIAKMLKTFTFEDLAMMSDLEVNTINKEIQELLAEGVITNNGKYYEYLGNTIPDSIKIINKKKPKLEESAWALKIEDIPSFR